MNWVSSKTGMSPLVLDSPHSGTEYPGDFGYSCAFDSLRRAEDTHVERLYELAPELGCAWVEAHFPRSYLDANRGLDEIDPLLLDQPWPGPLSEGAKVRLGKGLVWRMTDEGEPIYQRQLSVAEVQRRIAQCWQPYHAAVAEAIAAARKRHGYVIHINCHSMPAVASRYATLYPGEAHADFVIGNRDNTTSHPGLVALMQQWLLARGYSVSVNHPYKGVELVRRYSDPAAQRHSIQLEINRKLYMDEQTLAPHAGFNALQRDLRSLMQVLQDCDPRHL